MPYRSILTMSPHWKGPRRWSSKPVVTAALAFQRKDCPTAVEHQLYIVPAEGGTARRMLCNTPLMNSWHSFSPNGRRLVFSSKSRSPYTQMFLTHIDAQGNNSPAILIDNAMAANRAVNIPEFVNIPPTG